MGHSSLFTDLGLTGAVCMNYELLYEAAMRTYTSGTQRQLPKLQVIFGIYLKGDLLVEEWLTWELCN
jgi:hypothetical protein